MNYLVNQLFVYFFFLFKDLFSGRGVNKSLLRFSCIFLEMVEPYQLVDADHFIILGLIFHFIIFYILLRFYYTATKYTKHIIEKTQQNIQSATFT